RRDDGEAVNEWLVVAGIAIVAVSGAARRERGWAAMMCIAAALAIAGSLFSLIAPETSSPIAPAWRPPGAPFALAGAALSALSAMFEIEVFALAALGAIYGLGYWKQRDHAGNARKLRTFYGLMVAGMGLLGVARNLVLFMMGWEVMAIGAFMAITTEDDQVRV